MPNALAQEKAKLISKIKTIEDQSVIDDIMRLLAVNFDDSVYLLTEEQVSNVEEAREQIRSGKGIQSKDADAEIDGWLKE